MILHFEWGDLTLDKFNHGDVDKLVLTHALTQVTDAVPIPIENVLHISRGTFGSEVLGYDNDDPNIDQRFFNKTVQITTGGLTSEQVDNIAGDGEKHYHIPSGDITVKHIKRDEKFYKPAKTCNYRKWK